MNSLPGFLQLQAAWSHVSDVHKVKPNDFTANAWGISPFILTMKVSELTQLQKARALCARATYLLDKSRPRRKFPVLPSSLQGWCVSPLYGWRLRAACRGIAKALMQSPYVVKPEPAEMPARVTNSTSRIEWMRSRVPDWDASTSTSGVSSEEESASSCESMDLYVPSCSLSGGENASDLSWDDY
jgi:hypothetical protein